MENQERDPPVVVPAQALSEDALKGLIISFVLREGTDYGVQEITHDAKVEQVRRQIQAGEVKILFDPVSESVTLITSLEYKKLLC